MFGSLIASAIIGKTLIPKKRFKNILKPSKWKLSGKSAEEKAQERSSAVIKEDARTSLGLLREQFDRLSSPDSIINRAADLEIEGNRQQFQQQLGNLAATAGRANLAGSGAQQMARKQLSEGFRDRQQFTRDKALEDQRSQLDRLSLEMQNIISTTRASLAGMSKLNKSERTFDTSDFDEYI